MAQPSDGFADSPYSPATPFSMPPLPTTSGVSPLAGILSAVTGALGEHNRRQAGQELAQREALSNQFAAIASNLSYDRDTRAAAAHHQYALQDMPWNKSRPKEYMPDAKHGGAVPALSALMWRHQMQETARRGEIAPPPDPQQPAEPANPTNPMIAPAPPPASPASYADAMMVPQQAAQGPVTGGVKVGPNAISPSPAVGGVGGVTPGAAPISGVASDGTAPAGVALASLASPASLAAPSSASPASPVTPDGMSPTLMTPGESMVYNNSIPVSSLGLTDDMIEAAGLDPNSTINPKMVPQIISMAKSAADRKVKWAKLGLDADGNALPTAGLPPEVAYKQAMIGKAQADVDLAKARATGIPQQINIAQQHADAATQNAVTAARQVNVNATLVGLGGMGSAAGADDGTGAISPSAGVGNFAMTGDPNTDFRVKQTTAGNNYVDLTNISPRAKQMVAARYESMGVPVLNAKDVEAIHALDTARLNQDSMFQIISSKLPKDASGRPLGALTNKISQFLQTDEDIASFNSFRAAAIQSLTALAGGIGSGLRITQPEVTLALRNDIPQITDTLGAAVHKRDNIQAMLDNKETIFMNARRGGMRGSLGGRGTGTPNAMSGLNPGGQGQLSAPPKPGADDRSVTQSEWNVLIGKGHTPADLQKAGIHVQ